MLYILIFFFTPGYISISVYLMVQFRLYLKWHCAWQICVIANKSVIEALTISSEIQFSSDLMLICTHLQYLFTTFILPKLIYLFLYTISIPHPNHVYDKQRKKLF